MLSRWQPLVSNIPIPTYQIKVIPIAILQSSNIPSRDVHTNSDTDAVIYKICICIRKIWISFLDICLRIIFLLTASTPLLFIFCILDNGSFGPILFFWIFFRFLLELILNDFENNLGLFFSVFGLFYFF
jgi:hypothetical protein